MDDPEPKRLVLRPWPSLVVVATSSTAAFVLTGAFSLIPLHLNQNGYAWTGIGSIALLIFLLSVVRVRCVVSSDGIEVVNLWRTYSLPRQAVLRTEVAEGWLGAAFFLSNFSPIRIRTTDGRKIIVQASLLDDKGLIASAIDSGTSGRW